MGVCVCVWVYTCGCMCVCVWIRTRRPVILCMCVCAYLRACVGGVYMWVCGMFVCLFLYELSADTLLYVCVRVCSYAVYSEIHRHRDCLHLWHNWLPCILCDSDYYGVFFVLSRRALVWNGRGKGSGCVLACTSLRARSMCVFGGVLQGKRVGFVYVCVEQKIVWGLGVRVCADVWAYNKCMRERERVSARICVWEGKIKWQLLCVRAQGWL